MSQYQTMLLALHCIDLFFYMVENLLSEMKNICIWIYDSVRGANSAMSFSRRYYGFI